MGKEAANLGGHFTILTTIVTDTAFAFQFWKRQWFQVKRRCSYHTDLLFSLFLNLGFYLFVSTNKYVPPDFWRKFFKLFSFNTYCFFFMQCISSHIFCKSRGNLPQDFWWQNQKEEIWGRQHRRKLRFQNKGVS